jgi:hypothetical protein
VGILFRSFVVVGLQAGEGNAKYLDFKHKMTQAALGFGSQRNPPWVEAKLAALNTRESQVHKFSWNRRLARYVKAGHHEKTI